MAKQKFIKKAGSYLSKKVGVRGGVLIGSTAVGGLMGMNNAPAGFRRAGLKEGAISGAAMGTGLIFAPKLVRASAKSLVKASGKVAAKGGMVFRRVRGRIIPIKKG